jgi:hypothetical protein
MLDGKEAKRCVVGRRKNICWIAKKQKVCRGGVAELRLLCLLSFCCAAQLRFGNGHLHTGCSWPRASTVANFQV